MNDLATRYTVQDLRRLREHLERNSEYLTQQRKPRVLVANPAEQYIMDLRTLSLPCEMPMQDSSAWQQDTLKLPRMDIYEETLPMASMPITPMPEPSARLFLPAIAETLPNRDASQRQQQLHRHEKAVFWLVLCLPLVALAILFWFVLRG